MKRLPALQAIEPWPLATRLASAPSCSPWTLVATAPERALVVAEELKDQLESLLNGPVELARASSPQDLLELSSREPARALVIVGLDRLDADGWRRVDVNRSRLSREQPAVIVLDERVLPLVVEHAPNLWSWLSGSVWRGVLEGEAGDERWS